MTEPKIYVCMSSIPFRAKRLPIVLDSILANKVLPDKIFINICEKYERFPEEKFDLSVLDKYKDNKLITINTNCEDLGPGTKILGCLDKLLEEEEDIENTYLITADDDLLYQPTFIQEFRKNIKKNPENSYTGFKWGRGLWVNTDKFEICFGADGISFKLSQLKTLKNFCLELFKTNLRFKFHDDFCFTSFLHLNKIKTIKVSSPSRFPQKKSNYPVADEVSITNSNIGGNGKNSSCNDNSLCRLYKTLLNSGKLDVYKLQ